MVAWRRLADFDQSRSFGAWIRGIGARIAMDHAGKKRIAVADPAVIEQIERHATEFDGDHSIGFRGRLATLDECLARLPEEAAEVIRLAYESNWPLRMIATHMSLNEETVKKRVQRARGMLGDCLERNGVFA